MGDSQSQPIPHGYFIKYNPILSRYFGSQNATILFDRLEYWFAKKPGEFYKFIAPCDHPLCKKGDTWSEELGFSKKVFRTAFDKIGVRYKSKTEFEKEIDPFKGKFFAYYQDRQTKKTIFVRNTKILQDLYQKLKKNLTEKESTKSRGVGGETQPSGNQPRHKQNKTLKKPISEAHSNHFKKGSPTEDPLGSPHVGANTDKQITTSFSKMKPNLNSVRDDYAIIETKTTDMTKIWKEILGESSIPSLSTPSREKLYNRFLTVFNGSLEKWQEHCRKIGSSKFLMGEKSRGGHTYQLKFWVATSQPFTETLEAGVFELDTRTNERYETFKRTSSLAEAKRKANQEKGVVQDIRNYLIENYFTAYQACFSAAEMREEEGGVVSITCKTSWAKNYVRDNLMGAINKINRMWKVSAVIV